MVAGGLFVLNSRPPVRFGEPKAGSRCFAPRVAMVKTPDPGESNDLGIR